MLVSSCQHPELQILCFWIMEAHSVLNINNLLNLVVGMTCAPFYSVVETAENIGFACELLTEETTICYGEDIK